MAEKRRLFDVWIVETNIVYREVPFTVVADWVQQGRLLETDKLRPAGTTQWSRLGDTSALAAYLPKTEPYRAEDQAEALEPVQIDFTWKRRSADEEDDVDMIPLIDISLVLLIFFMMTSTVVVSAARINVPKAEYAYIAGNPEMLWIGIDRTPQGKPVYSLGQGDHGAAAEDRDLMEEAHILARLDARLQEARTLVDVRIMGHQALPYEEVILSLTVGLEKLRRKHPQLRHIYAEVSEKTP